ncbi:MAG: PIN domain-containing protein [Deltaproteobacteria bacterium]|nr:PIN domain-containing protein [Deltaproteobacteria bacterium]
MSAEPCFVDTNVLVYARDASESRKQPLASAWIEMLWERRLGRLSFQVLAEFYVTVTQKLDPGLTREDARAELRDLMAWRPAAIDATVMDRAFAIQDRFRLSWWDAQIVAAAQVLGCRYLLSEDLASGQRFDGLEVVDPFRRPPDAVLA